MLNMNSDFLWSSNFSLVGGRLFCVLLVGGRWSVGRLVGGLFYVVGCLEFCWSVVGGRLVVGTWSVFGGFEETPILVALYPIHYIR